jgi:hypothetical protein
VRLQVAPDSGTLTMELGDLFDDGRLRQAIHRGLPLRIAVRVELWNDAFFDTEEATGEWRASVLWDPVVQRYRVRVGEGDPVEVQTLEVVTGVLQNRFDLPIGPSGPGRYYYLATVEMETLSLSDLEELQRWLSGELAPAVRGEGDVDGAVARGMRRLLVRALGLPTRRLRLRSPTFEVGRGDTGGG